MTSAAQVIGSIHQSAYDTRFDSYPSIPAEDWTPTLKQVKKYLDSPRNSLADWAMQAFALQWPALEQLAAHKPTAGLSVAKGRSKLRGGGASKNKQKSKKKQTGDKGKEKEEEKDTASKDKFRARVHALVREMAELSETVNA